MSFVQLERSSQQGREHHHWRRGRRCRRYGGITRASCQLSRLLPRRGNTPRDGVAAAFALATKPGRQCSSRIRTTARSGATYREAPSGAVASAKHRPRNLLHARNSGDAGHRHRRDARPRWHTGPADDHPRHPADSRYAISMPVRRSGKPETNSSVFHRLLWDAWRANLQTMCGVSV